MAITVLPPSPSGQILHDTVRLKVNEVVNQVNVIPLAPATYGNFNAAAWHNEPSGSFTVTGIESDFAFQPATSILLGGGVIYTFKVFHINVSGFYFQRISFSTSSMPPELYKSYALTR